MHPTKILPAIAADIAFAAGDSAVLCQVVERIAELPTAVSKAGEACDAWVIGLPALGELLEPFAQLPDVTLFAVDELPGHVFATNQPLAVTKCRILAHNGQIGVQVPAPETESEPTVVDKRHVSRLIKTAEERFVLGVVLVPEVADSQGDIYSHEEVRKAAHHYLEMTAGTLGKQHGEIVTGKLKVLENYVAPADFQIGDESVTAGTWLLGIRVVDDELWTAVKSGSFTGFSIGGTAYRRPEAD